MGWHTPLVPAPRRQRQAKLHEFEASLLFKVSSRTGEATQRNSESKRGGRRGGGKGRGKKEGKGEGEKRRREILFF